ncbi:MAG: methyltransferase [Tissierellia bacterium]|nr:methyltransferase [Tissierellia bacterium]
MKGIIEKAGFSRHTIFTEEVTDEYAKKWGHGLMLKEFIQSGMLIGSK